MSGEVAAVMSAGPSVALADAVALLDGYAGPPHQHWSDGRFALAASGDANLKVFGDVVVAVDGRLDNRADIARLVGSAVDAPLEEMIAEGWRRVGTELVDRLVGDLAVVIADRACGELCAFRDLCAGRALHVSRGPGTWSVATEWQPLLAVGERRKPDPEWFASAFVGHSINPAATPYRGVEMILPGHLATPTRDGWRQTRIAGWVVPELRDTRQGAYADEFRVLFDEAVRCRVAGRPDGVAVALSGGLDSTSVLATAHVVRPDVPRMSLCLPLTHPAGDERAMQSHMAQRSLSTLRWVDMGQLGPYGEDGPEALFERFGAPPQVVNWFYGDALAREAQQARVSVVLDGEDGDGSVGGSHGYLADLVVRGRWRRWLHEVNAMRALGFVSGRDMVRDSIELSLPPRLRRFARGANQGGYVPETLADGFARRLDLEERLRVSFLNQQWAPGRAFALAQREVGEPYHTAPKYTTISEPWRRRGVELTHPWADRRLMSFCMGLPYVHVRSNALPKVVLRQAMVGRLPEVLLEHNGKADMSEVVKRAVRGRDRVVVQEGLQLARSQPEWFAADTVRTLETSLDSDQSITMATRVAMFARWLRWCDAG